MQSTVETVPINAFSFTPHFSMFSPLAPSLEMFVTYGPAVVQPARETAIIRDVAIFFILVSPWLGVVWDIPGICLHIAYKSESQKQQSPHKAG